MPFERQCQVVRTNFGPQTDLPGSMRGIAHPLHQLIGAIDGMTRADAAGSKKRREETPAAGFGSGSQKGRFTGTRAEFFVAHRTDT